MAQDGASRRLTIILSVSLIAIVGLGIWIAVLIGRAQPSQDPDAPATTSQSSTVEQSVNASDGDGGGQPEVPDSTAEETSAPETSAPETLATPADDGSSDPATFPDTDDQVTDDVPPSESVEQPGPATDPTVVQQSAP